MGFVRHRGLDSFCKVALFRVLFHGRRPLAPAPPSLGNTVIGSTVVSLSAMTSARLGSMYSTMILGSTSYEDYVREIGSSNVARWTNKISPACSFEQFWKAWERGTLMTMFEKCWPYYLPTEDTFGNPEHDLLNRLRAFLEAETPHPSIWSLRHFLAMEGASVESAAPGIARAARDYGFSEQLNARTTMELSKFYLQLMKSAEPLTVHRERMKGNLVQFVEGRVDIITPRVKELLQGLP